MNAKEWLIEQRFSENIASLDCVNKDEFGYPLQLLLESYANFKIKNLEAQIIYFRQMLKKVDTSIGGTVVICEEECIDIIDFYDKTFNIEKIR